MHTHHKIMLERDISFKHVILHLESLMHVQEPIQVIKAYLLSQNHIHYKTNHAKPSQVNHTYQHTRTYNQDNSIIKL